MILPLILVAKTAATKDDNPTWWQAMNGPDVKEFWKAAQIEIDTLEKINAWTVAPQTDDITNVLPPPGHSKSINTQMALSRSSRDISVLVKTSKFKDLISLKPTAQLCNRPLSV
jgi:hypothetical protein